MLGFNDRLIKAIQELIPKKKDQQAFLKEIMPLGKETIYRRLRGEIPFTFSEACTIANKLKISLDSLVRVESLNNPSFLLELPSHPYECINRKLQQHEQSYAYFIQNPNLIIKSAFSFVPYSLLLPFDELFRFKMFIYLYQLDFQKAPKSYSEFILPEDMDVRRLSLSQQRPALPKDITIVDRKIFEYLIDEINFFHSLGILSIAKKHQLKDEMLELLRHFEYLTSYGIRETGDGESMIYLSNINLYQSYTYVKGPDFECSYMDGIYSMNTILSTDPRVCKMHEKWIESLKRFSTLISVSGEIERRAFFFQQRKLIEETLC